MTDRNTTPPANLRELLRVAFRPVREFLDEPLPEGVNFAHTTGSLCLFLAFVQVVTGVLMAFYYTPSPEVAWESVRYVDEKVTFGAVIHGLHHWGSSAFVVAVFIHLIRVFTFGAYKGQRKWTWLAGVGLLAVVLGFGFTGYLLPWDMKAYFGTKVGTNIVGYAPVVGPYARNFLLGGPEISEITLPRFYALHTLVLPGALAALVAVHLFLIRLYGITPPWKRDGEKVEYPFRFFPTQALRDSLVMAAALCVLLVLAATLGGMTEEKADPLSTNYAPHPEWYFLGLQQLLRYFRGPYQIIGTVIIPAGFFLALVALPFVDRNPERRLPRRPIAASLGGVTILAIVGLTMLGYSQLRSERAEMAAAAAEAAEAADASTQVATESGQPEFTEGMERFGKRLYEASECAHCHEGEKAGHDLNAPPSLAYVGDRFTPRGLLDYMAEVPRRRWLREDRRPIERMPHYRFEGRELDSIVAFMLTMREPERFEGVEFDGAAATPEQIELGEQLYVSEKCDRCHVIAGEGTPTAPDLDDVAARLHPEFIFTIIKTPQDLIPDTTMEDSFLDDEEIMALTHYLMTLP